MNLSFLGVCDEEINEHKIAWLERDWDEVGRLCSQFEKEPSVGLFDIIRNVTEKTGHKSVDYFDDYNQYMINHFLSQHVHLIGYVSELNKMELTDQMHYDYLYYTVRRCKLPFVKAAKLEDDWEKVVIYTLMCHVFKVSMAKAMEMYETMGDEKVNKFKKEVASLVDSENSQFLERLPTKAVKRTVLKNIKSW